VGLRPNLRAGPRTGIIMVWPTAALAGQRLEFEIDMAKISGISHIHLYVRDPDRSLGSTAEFSASKRSFGWANSCSPVHRTQVPG
jgi:hypothetical protein